MKITEISINNRTSVFVLMFIVIIAGILSYIGLPRESAPDIKIPLVVISTPYFGVAPGDIESLVTQKIETELNSISEIKKITSTSAEGFSSIICEFESGYDIDDALQKVRDKVNKAKPKLPSEAEESDVSEINFSEFPIFTFALTGKIDLTQLKDISDDIKEDIEKINGVLDCKISGGLDREVKVNVDVNKLEHYKIPFGDIISAIQSENQTIPGGVIDNVNSSFLIRVPGEYTEPFSIEDIVIKVENDLPIYIRDVAQIEYSFKERQTYSRLNEKEAITISVSKRIGSNIIDMVNEINEVIENYKQKYNNQIDFTVVVDFSQDIKRSVRNLENNIFSGLVLVLLVLFAFLGLRTASFVGFAIPMSMLLSFIILSLLNITLNFIVLFSLILALGMLVDNAIVIVENIYKFLEDGYPLEEAAKLGAKEVAWPITTSTLTTLVAFGPLLFWPGVVGDFMQYLPITLIVTLSSSLFVALVMNPVLTSKYMKLEIYNKPRKGLKLILIPFDRITALNNELILPWILTNYERILKNFVGKERESGKPIAKRNLIGLALTFVLFLFSSELIFLPFLPKFITIIITILLTLCVVWVFSSNNLRVLSATFLSLFLIIEIYSVFDLGTEFFPETDPQRIYINIEAPLGTNVERTNVIAKKIENVVKPLQGTDISEYIASVGTSTNQFDFGSGAIPNKGSITVQFPNYVNRRIPSPILTDSIRESIKNIAGATLEVKKEKMGPPVGSPITIEITGDNFEELGKISGNIQDVVKTIPGVVDLKDDYDLGKPEVRVVINREKAALFNLNTSTIANSVRTAINGTEASKFRILQDEYDIVVRLEKDQRSSVDILKDLPIVYNFMGKVYCVPLITVADLEYSTGPGAINRKDLKRMVTITGNVDENYNANAVLSDVMKSLENYQLKQGYFINFGGQNEEQEEASKFLSKAFFIALFGIFLILVVQFNSFAQPMLIMFAVIISLIGVFLGQIAFQMPFGIVMTGIGVISLAGVIVNNNIVLVDYINILLKRGMTVKEAVVQAGIRRFRPVTLTALTTVLGLIPLTFGFGFDVATFAFKNGGEDAQFWRSMGVAVIFGLTFGTVLTLIIMPVMFSVVDESKMAIKDTITHWKIKIKK